VIGFYIQARNNYTWNEWENTGVAGWGEERMSAPLISFSVSPSVLSPSSVGWHTGLAVVLNANYRLNLFNAGVKRVFAGLREYGTSPPPTRVLCCSSTQYVTLGSHNDGEQWRIWLLEYLSSVLTSESIDCQRDAISWQLTTGLSIDFHLIKMCSFSWRIFRHIWETCRLIKNSLITFKNYYTYFSKFPCHRSRMRILWIKK